MESTLAAQYKDLLGDVSFFLGYGRGAENGDLTLSTQQAAATARCVKGGLRNFYHCGYNWSFLKPLITLSLPSGESTVALPADAGGPEGRAVLVGATNQTYTSMEFRSIGEVIERENDPANQGYTGAPEVLCLEPVKGTSATEGQRLQVHVYPPADQDYTLEFQVYINPNYLSGNMPYAYGGAEHAQTLLEACLAEAEMLMDGAVGVHAQRFLAQLEISKQMDQRKKPQVMGPCLDRGERDWRYDRHDLGSYTATFYGTIPG